MATAKASAASHKGNGHDTQADSLSAKAQAASQAMAEQASATAQAAAEQAVQAQETVVEMIRKNPGTAVAAALGIGVVLGLALRRD